MRAPTPVVHSLTTRRDPRKPCARARRRCGSPPPIRHPARAGKAPGALPDTEHVCAGAPDGLAHQLAAMPGATHDLLDRVSGLPQRQDLPRGVLPPQEALILEPFGRGQQGRVDRRAPMALQMARIDRRTASRMRRWRSPSGASDRQPEWHRAARGRQPRHSRRPSHATRCSSRGADAATLRPSPVNRPGNGCHIGAQWTPITPLTEPLFHAYPHGSTGGLPGTLIATVGTVPDASLSTTPPLVTFDAPAGVALTAGTRYWIQVTGCSKADITGRSCVFRLPDA